MRKLWMTPALVVASLVALPLGTGDLIEDTLGPVVGDAAQWQYDGHQEGDAADTCEGANHEQVPPTNSTGLLVPHEDDADYYAVAVGDNLVGVPLVFSIVPEILNIGFDVFTPGCGFSLKEFAAGEIPGGHGQGNPGEGHKCDKPGERGGHPECLATNVDVGDDFVAFTPLAPGAWASAVRLVANGTPEPPSRVPLSCHSTCIRTLNGEAGYEQFFNL